MLETEAKGFRGSFSGYERDRLFYNPDGDAASFVQSAYVFGLDDDHDGRAAAPVDIDGDGDLDLALLTLRGLKLFENTSTPRHFARVRLVGARPRVDALSAEVILDAGGAARRDFVKITEGFRTQVPRDLHFGLGESTTVDRLEVRWPSGNVEVWNDLPSDRLLVVREGMTDVDARPLARWPEGTRPTLTGAPSPSVVADRLAGGSGPIGNGRATVVNFWAPWCAPCNVELPQLVGLSERYRSEVDFAGLSVELDDLESVRKTIDRFRIPYPQFFADEGVMEQFFGDSTAGAALPSTFVFDASGALRRVFGGAITEADLEGLLESLRDESESEPKLRLLAETYFASGDYDRAVEYYRRLSELSPQQIGQVGMAWEQQRRADRARLAAAWVGKARAHRGRGETHEARESYERVLELDPRNQVAAQALLEFR